MTQEKELTPKQIAELIEEVDNLLDPKTMFGIRDLYSLQQKTVNRLLEFGSEFDEIRRKVEAIKFEPTVTYHPSFALDPDRLAIMPTGWSLEKCNKYIARQLDSLKILLTIAKKRAERTQVDRADLPEPSGQSKDATRVTLLEKDDLKRRIGRNIAKLAKESGWSYEELSRKTGIDKKLVVCHIHGKNRPNPRTLKLYADAFTIALNRSITPNQLEEPD